MTIIVDRPPELCNECGHELTDPETIDYGFCSDVCAVRHWYGKARWYKDRWLALYRQLKDRERLLDDIRTELQIGDTISERTWNRICDALGKEH